MREEVKIGDMVSYGFNGDAYPDSKVVRITPTGIVVTESGKRYYPDGHGNHKTGGTWYLYLGYFKKQNPHF